MNEAVRVLIVSNEAAKDPARQRLVAAGVTAASIQEPGEIDPRQPGARPDAQEQPGRDFSSGAISVLNAAIPLDQPGPQAPAVAPVRPGHCFPPGDGLRLIPLSGFHWGGALRGRNAAPAPRVRGDHVLIWLQQGTLQVEFPRHCHGLAPGCLAFIPAGTAFALRPGAEVQGRALLIAPAHGAALPVPLPPGFRSGTPLPQDRPLIEPAMQALGIAQPQAGTGQTAAGQTPTGQAAIACQMALIALALSRMDARSAAQRPGPAALHEARPLAERFIELAEAELAQNQTIAELARRLGHSLAQLDRACRQCRGRSALEVLYDLRHESAAKALRDGDLPICDIARELGYSGLGHFIRSFAAATGRSPEAYRDFMRSAAARGGA